MPEKLYNVRGLSREEVQLARARFGPNIFIAAPENAFLVILKKIGKEPMTIMLMVASAIYFISGKTGDGIFMAVAIIFQVSISLYQSARSGHALDKLKEFSEATCTVIREGETLAIKSEEVVVGDSLIIQEGTSVPADGTIIHSNDFSVNESILTGESLAVYKDENSPDHAVYSGTTVTSGLAIVTVTSIGNQTRLGKIGISLQRIPEEKSPLELQIADFVKKMALAGALVFLLVWAINYWHTRAFLNSLLQSLTLAMSILPEEIPVAFTTFMALGAWRLMKLGIVVKQMKTVETLGSATVICSDKTGTLTQNKMSLAQLYLLEGNQFMAPGSGTFTMEAELLATAMWASEPIPFDPMETALHQAYGENIQTDERSLYQLVHEYPLGGKPPMMTHVFRNAEGRRIIAAKGAPEALMRVSQLSVAEQEQVRAALAVLSSEGYRVLAVGSSPYSAPDFPVTQQELPFRFIGLIAFYDPPKKDIESVLANFYRAGIIVKIITGDNAATTQAIARQIGIRGYENGISGAELMSLDSTALAACVKTTTIFSRMFPEAKLAIINALKSNHEVVAMTGDGVNDGPALKAAHIGIAMGKKGTEIARQAASLILLEDDLSMMVSAIAMGRKIYANLKKAIQYIISIHIPIILTVFIPVALGWTYPNIFSPVHIIFFELIMGPTCSIIYENEPMEKNTMSQKPKALTTTFFNWQELSVSIVQGLVIAAGSLFVYQYAVRQGYPESLVRTMAFTTLISANIFLTLVNRSFYYSVFTTLRYKNNMILLIILITTSATASMLYFKPVAHFFGFEHPGPQQLLVPVITGLVSVAWFEVVKFVKRTKLPAGLAEKLAASSP